MERTTGQADAATMVVTCY